MKIKQIILLFVLLWSTGLIYANGKDQDQRGLVQVSGVSVTGDSLSPLPFTEIIIKDSYRGTISDYYGFFSLVAKKGDTLIFKSLGYHDAHYILPDTLAKARYSLIQKMTRDTLQLDEFEIYPWPSREQFKAAFLNLDISDDDYERARKNMHRDQLAAAAATMSPDAAGSYKYAMRADQSQLYYAGQAPPNNLMNPVAWAQFVQAWKRGDFKR